MQIQKQQRHLFLRFKNELVCGLFYHVWSNCLLESQSTTLYLGSVDTKSTDIWNPVPKKDPSDATVTTPQELEQLHERISAYLAAVCLFVIDFLFLSFRKMLRSKKN